MLGSSKALIACFFVALALIAGPNGVMLCLHTTGLCVDSAAAQVKSPKEIHCAHGPTSSPCASVAENELNNDAHCGDCLDVLVPGFELGEIRPEESALDQLVAPPLIVARLDADLPFPAKPAPRQSPPARGPPIPELSTFVTQTQVLRI